MGTLNANHLTLLICTYEIFLLRFITFVCPVNSRMCLVTERELQEIARQQQKQKQLLERQEKEQTRRRIFEEQVSALKKMKEQIEGMCNSLCTLNKIIHLIIIKYSIS